MTENGWQAIGRIAKERRERLGLDQDELAQYGGPGVSTVGKFERAAQPSFPLRTQHKMEKALGWSRGVVEQVVGAVDEGESIEDWEHDLVLEDIPDMSEPVKVAHDIDPQLTDAVASYTYLLTLVEEEVRPPAIRDSIAALLPYLSMPGAAQLGSDLRRQHLLRGGDEDAGSSAATQAPEVGPADQPTRIDLPFAADEDDVTIEREQEETEQST